MFYVDLPSFVDLKNPASKDLAQWDVWASALFPQFICKAESIARGIDCGAKRMEWEYENSERKSLIVFSAWNIFPKQNRTWLCLQMPQKTSQENWSLVYDMFCSGSPVWTRVSCKSVFVLSTTAAGVILNNLENLTSPEKQSIIFW